MPRIFRRRGFSARKKSVYWDSLRVAQAALPQNLLDETAVIGSNFSGIQRYTTGPDRTIRRSIIDFAVRVNQLDFQVNRNAVVEVCVGIGQRDSTQDTDGLAINTVMSPGTGPLSDASNSHWMVRCCVQIPIGILLDMGSTDNVAWTPHPGSSLVAIGGTAAQASIWWFCHVDTKQMRKLHGQQTPWTNVAMESNIQPTGAAGDDISVTMNAFSVRWLFQNAS